MNKDIAIIGGGNLGSAIALGLLKEDLCKPHQITITRRHLSRLEYLADQGFNLSDNNVEAVKNTDIIILCVQPKQLDGLMEEIQPVLKSEKHILVSTITGVTTEHIENTLPFSMPLVRAMPNTAVAIGDSMTCICSKYASEEQVNIIGSLFDALGQTLVIEERLMKAATVLGASGIAFFMRYLRAATQGGIQLGFDATEAQMIAVQTAKGASRLILENGNHPEIEIDKVTTPEGCTIAGLNEMEHQGLSSALIKGILTSFEKINNIT